MNYVAHLLLSTPTDKHRIGSLLADFTVGTMDTMHAKFGKDIAAGILHHREVDRYTDTHPVVNRAVQHIKEDFGLYSSIVVDVVFDHYLMKHWSAYSSLKMETFLEDAYRSLQHVDLKDALYPKRFRQVIGRLLERRWLASYLQIETVGVALNRISERFSHETPLSNALPGILAGYERLETCFLQFFPQLADFSDDYLAKRMPPVAK